MKKLIAITIAAAALLGPAAATAHDYTQATTCTSTVPGASNDCVRVDTDTEFEGGLIVTLDGDDSNPRGDDISDGYIAVEVTRDGATVYCEDEGGFNHIEERDGGDADDANGTNEVCDPV